MGGPASLARCCRSSAARGSASAPVVEAPPPRHPPPPLCRGLSQPAPATAHAPCFTARYRSPAPGAPSARRRAARTATAGPGATDQQGPCCRAPGLWGQRLAAHSAAAPAPPAPPVQTGAVEPQQALVLVLLSVFLAEAVALGAVLGPPDWGRRALVAVEAPGAASAPSTTASSPRPAPGVPSARSRVGVATATVGARGPVAAAAMARVTP